MRIDWLKSRARTLQVAIGFVLCAWLPALPAQAEIDKRVALVIGNSAYKSALVLENPVTDAKAVAAALKRIGFEVIEGYDLGTSDMRNILAQFSAALPDSKAAMVYYAGHGVSVDEENFLIPTDLTLKSQTDLDLNAISLSLVLKQMKREERVNVLILDACRDNPFAADLQRGMRNRSAVAERGLSRVETDLAKGTLIAFATDPKSTALDGKPGDNSPFTKALLRHIEEPGISIDAVMNRVRADVWEETKQRQMPWVNTSIIGEFVLNPVTAARQQMASLPNAGGEAPLVGSPASERLAQENKLWDSAERGNSSDDYRAYLDAYPNGIYAQMAKSRIARLNGPATAAVAAVAAPIAATTTASLVEATRSKNPAAEALKAEVGSQQTEKQLALNLKARKEIQQRLIAMGFDPGEANGTFTDKTRRAIADWQKRNDMQPTTWLAPLQRKALMEQSEEAWKRIAALRAEPAPTRELKRTRQQPAVSRATERHATPVREGRPQRAPREEPEPRGQAANPMGAFIGGMAVGGALGILGRR